MQARLVVHDAEVGLHEARERLRLGVLALHAAVRARHVGEPVLSGATLACLEVLDQGVGAEALVAVEALDERVGERRDVAGCLPYALGQDDRRVQAHHVAASAHERLPPLTADVLLELGAEGAVVPGGAGSAVDLTGLEDEPAVAGEGDDFVEAGLLGHGGSNGRERERKVADAAARGIRRVYPRLPGPSAQQGRVRPAPWLPPYARGLRCRASGGRQSWATRQRHSRTTCSRGCWAATRCSRSMSATGSACTARWPSDRGRSTELAEAAGPAPALRAGVARAAGGRRHPHRRRRRSFTLPAAHATVLVDPASLAVLRTARPHDDGGRDADARPARRLPHGRRRGLVGVRRRRTRRAGRRQPPVVRARARRRRWPSVPRVHDVLSRPGARIADVGCGHGWASIALASAYPSAPVDGLRRRRAVDRGGAPARGGDGSRDLHDPRGGEELATAGQRGSYDAAFVFEALHDMPDPVAVLASAASRRTTGWRRRRHGRGRRRRVRAGRRRGRAHHVRLQPLHLPARLDVDARIRRHRHRDATGDARALRARSGVRRHGGAPDRRGSRPSASICSSGSAQRRGVQPGGVGPSPRARSRSAARDQPCAASTPSKPPRARRNPTSS